MTDSSKNRLIHKYIIAALLLAPTVAFAMSPIIEDAQRPIRHEPELQHPRPDAQHYKRLGREELLVLVIRAAAKYNVNADAIIKTIDCESGFNPRKGGDFSTTTEEFTSWGLAQINLPSHPEVTEAQATDPYFAVEFIAREFHEGHEFLWTCWRNQFHP